MKKACLITINIGKSNEYASLTIPSIKSYAKSHDYDFFELTDIGNHVSPHWLKMDAVDYLNKYNYCIYVDCDTYIMKHSPDILQNISINDSWDICSYKHGPYDYPDGKDRSNLYKMWTDQYVKQVGLEPIPEYTGDPYINSGVIVFSQGFKRYSSYKLPETDKVNIKDQSAFNYCIHKKMLSNSFLDKKFNFPYNVLQPSDMHTNDIYFIHFWGNNRDKTSDINKFLKLYSL